MSNNWYEQYRSTSVTHAVSMALKDGSGDPFRMLAIAVIASAYSQHDTIDQLWVDLADVHAAQLGIRVAV